MGMDASAVAGRTGESEERYRLLFDANPIPLWVFDVETLRFLAVNEAAVAKYGWSREEFLGKSIRDIRAPEDMPALLEAMVQVQEGVERAGVWKHRTREGRTILADITAHAMEFAGRRAIFVAAQDVTDFLRAQAEIREGEERLRKITAAASDAIVLIDEGDRIVLWNEAAGRIFGWSREEALGRDLADLVVPARHAGSHREASGRFLEGGDGSWAGRPLETVGRRKDGTEVPVELNVSPVDLGGRRHAVGIIRDISGRRRAEEQLLTLSRAVEQSPASIVITDTAGTIQFVNPQFCRVSGYAREEVLGGNSRLLKSGRHSQEFYAGLWKTICSGRDWRGEVQNRRKDGTLFWESATISPVKDAEGRVTNFVAVKEDITSRKFLEEELRQAQKMEAVGRLAGGIAHDFNNLLTVMGGYAELALVQTGPSDPRRPMLAEIHRASERAAALTRQLLAFSRRQVLQPVVLDLNSSVSGMEKMLPRLLGEDVAVELRLDPGLHPVLADPGQVDQAIMNLAVNARDAMPGGGKLVISTRNVAVVSGSSMATAGANPGPHACLEVRDTGTGMSEEVKAHIFEPFFTTKPQGKGTGLGLPMVYGFVRQSGGSIEVETAVGQGTAFRILLPRAESANAGPASGPVPAALQGTETVLVVEDEKAVATVARLALVEAGYRVLMADGASAAVRICGEHQGPIDLLLTDVVMPGMDGRETADLVSGLRPGIGVLFMSGYTDDVIGHHGILDPGLAFISKPFHPAALCAKVREVLDALGKTRDGARP